MGATRDKSAALRWLKEAWGVLLAGIACAVVLSGMALCYGEDTARTLASAWSAVATTVGFAWAIFQLTKEYKWRKRQAAVSMLAEWNRHTAQNRDKIAAAYPGILDANKTSPLTIDKAHLLYINPGNETRRAVIELLNYCEFVAVSISNDAVDSTIAETSVLETIIEWYVSLQAFVACRHVYRGRNPWQPLHDFVIERDKKSSPDRPTLSNYEELLKQANAKKCTETAQEGGERSKEKA